MSATTSRFMLQRTRFIARRTALRHASTTSEATEAASNTASKAKDTASTATSKASQGLSRVTSSAESAASGAKEGASNAAGKVAGRTGRLVSMIESTIPPTIYYSKVGFELSKLVFQGQKMTPPSLSTFQSYFQSIYKAVLNPIPTFNRLISTASSMGPESVMSRFRNINAQQMASVGVIAAEVIGFFTVGEMLGRLKLVGYRGDEEHHETATPHS